MSFRLVEEKLNNEGNNFKSCKEFFKDIRYHKEVNNSSPLKTDMDNFMLCLILGLKLNKKEKYQNYKFQSSPFASQYIDAYLDTRESITGLLLLKIIKSKNVDKNDKEKVKNLLQEVLDTNESIYLKKEYIDLMHEYYVGGYCALLNEFNNKPPEEVSVFFEKYNNL